MGLCGDCSILTIKLTSQSKLDHQTEYDHLTDLMQSIHPLNSYLFGYDLISNL